MTTEDRNRRPRKERPFAGLAADYDDLIGRRPKQRRGSGWLLRLVAAVMVITVIFPVAWVLLYGVFEAPGTILMAQRAMQGENVRRTARPLEAISPHLVRAVIAAEDARFCAHNGFDVEAIQKAVKYNERARERGSNKRRGASTVSQQTAKNLFLWPQRSWVRKGLEVYFTVLVESLWSKRRIMEAYLNAAEWGDGIFGAEAAAQARFGKSARDLTASEAARLAAVLPSPNKWSVNSPGPYVRGRARAIMARASVVRADGLASCVLGEERIARPGRNRPKELPPLPAPPPELMPVDEDPVERPEVNALPQAEPAPDAGADAGAAPAPEVVEPAPLRERHEEPAPAPADAPPSPPP